MFTQTHHSLTLSFPSFPLSENTSHSSGGVPSLCTRLFSSADMSSLQQPHCTFALTLPILALSHTHTYTLTQYMSTHKKTHTEGRAHAQLVNSPAAANRWQQASGWRKIVWVGWKRRAKNTCLFRQHPDVLRVFLSVRCGQEIRQEEMRAVHY